VLAGVEGRHLQFDLRRPVDLGDEELLQPGLAWSVLALAFLPVERRFQPGPVPGVED
jgi:hypothetical protein